MTNSSVVSLTQSAQFGDVFEVRAGLNAVEATRKASALAESIQYLANDGAQDGMPMEVAGLIAFAAESIRALMTSVDPGYVNGTAA